MFKTVTSKGEDTRDRIYNAALALFRERGFDATTMRDIASAAGMSLGAAYHYFPSKEALVMDYYEWMQSEHERRFSVAVPRDADFKTKLGALFNTKLDMLGQDRKLLAALFRNLGDPTHSLSV